MQTSPRPARGYRQCEHCGSPALRGESLCFYHHPEGRTRLAQKRLALRPDPTKLAIRNFAEAWPSHPISSQQRRLLQFAFNIAMNVPSDWEL